MITIRFSSMVGSLQRAPLAELPYTITESRCQAAQEITDALRAPDGRPIGLCHSKSRAGRVLILILQLALGHRRRGLGRRAPVFARNRLLDEFLHRLNG